MRGDTPIKESSHTITPQCPPSPATSNLFYEFEPVTRGSHTYRYSCTGNVEYEDGLGVHVITTTVSGTLTLP